MKTGLLVVTAIGILLTGCTTSNLPKGALLVGGGLIVDYEAPSDGTVILIERTSGKIVATESKNEGETFDFSPNYAGYSEVLFSLFSQTNEFETAAEFPQFPKNSCFQLYFVPTKAKRE